MSALGLNLWVFFGVFFQAGGAALFLVPFFFWWIEEEGGWYDFFEALLEGFDLLLSPLGGYVPPVRVFTRPILQHGRASVSVSVPVGLGIFRPSCFVFESCSRFPFRPFVSLCWHSFPGTVGASPVLCSWYRWSWISSMPCCCFGPVQSSRVSRPRGLLRSPTAFPCTFVPVEVCV